MSGIFHEGRWYENTDMICRRCGRPVYDSDNPEYCYQCFHCDEDFYSFEVEEQDALYFSKSARGGGVSFMPRLHLRGFGAFLFCGGARK